MQAFDIIGWIACGCSLTGAALATSRPRKVAMWGWVLFLIANVCWVLYGLTQAGILIPLVVYNMVRAYFNLRGINNNTKKRKLEIIKQRQAQCSQKQK